MRRVILAAGALLAATPALAVDFGNAGPQTTAGLPSVAGYLDLQGGHSWVGDNRIGDYETNHYDIAGRVNFMFGPRFNLQLDAWDEEIDYPGPLDASAYGGAAHFNWRDPNSFLFGGEVSVGNFADVDYANAALEAQRYIGNVTLYVQGGYGWSYDLPVDLTMPYGHLLARYFVNPDLMLEGQAGYGLFMVDDHANADVVRWEARVERKLPRLPFSAYLAYQGTWRHARDVVADSTDNALVAGIRLISTDTLQANDRRGATLIDENPLFGYPSWRN